MSFVVKIYEDGVLKETTAVPDDDWFLLCTGRCYVANQQLFPGTGTVNLTIKKEKS
jgi:hypothetical protein